MHAPRRPDRRRLLHFPPGTPPWPRGVNRSGIGRRRWFLFHVWLRFGRCDRAPAEHAGPTEWIERAISRIPGAA
jgi:hypothetical protein